MEYWKGKGAQINVPNRFSEQRIAIDDMDGQDEQLLVNKPKTEIFYESPKKVISKNKSPDIPLSVSVNPYQGCEHGCVYCYARNSHEYWGFGAGLDFESKIIVKKDVASMLEKAFLAKGYQPEPIMLSGNTDCYQPLEKKFELTRQILTTCWNYRHPVGIVTKNTLVTRDLDILKKLANQNLVKVIFSITSEDEELRRILEPRTASASKKFKAIRQLSDEGVPIGVMNAPIIPSLNHTEIPAILEKSAAHGAQFAGYTVVRLNGQVQKIFKDWLLKNFPARAEKVWHQVQELHGGRVDDSQFGRRIVGDGQMASVIKQLFEISRNKHFVASEKTILDKTKFRRGGNYTLF